MGGVKGPGYFQVNPISSDAHTSRDAEGRGLLKKLSLITSDGKKVSGVK